MTTPRIGIVGSANRNGRFGTNPADWIEDPGAGRSDFGLELIDTSSAFMGYGLLGCTRVPREQASIAGEVTIA